MTLDAGNPAPAAGRRHHPAVMVFAGGHFYRNARRALMNGSATMDTRWRSVPALPGLLDRRQHLARFLPDGGAPPLLRGQRDDHRFDQPGHALEQRARQRSSQALERLLDLTPPTARLVTDDGERDIPLAEVQLGMTLRLTTGDRVPVDGEIVQCEVWPR